MSYSPTASHLRIDVNDPTNAPLDESSRFAERVEELGFAGVGMPDHPHTGRDVFVRLALAAQRTSRVTLFPSVTNPVSRGPRMLATLGATLGELAPGRARLVVSSGKAAVAYVDGERATVSQVAGAVETVRETLAARFAPVGPVPVYVNASSPRMLSAAGAAADGVYAMVGVDADVVATAMAYVAAGARDAGRDPDSVAVALGLPVFMAESTAEAYESAAEYALINLSTRSRVFSRVLRERTSALEGVSQASELSSAQLHSVVDAMVIAGTPQEAAAKALSFAESTKRRHFIARVEFADEDAFRAIEVFSAGLRALGGEGVLLPGD
ncbi:MAG: LLM class flavin-dependent oxidoreductase [Chloroflexi bacterium]|nr:LLM class flavin-dependent oxidoreductase [Chloroflexota bacterium]